MHISCDKLLLNSKYRKQQRSRSTKTYAGRAINKRTILWCNLYFSYVICILYHQKYHIQICIKLVWSLSSVFFCVQIQLLRPKKCSQINIKSIPKKNIFLFVLTYSSTAQQMRLILDVRKEEEEWKNK